eukprot:5749985-Amphidinium_carterae.1
MSRVHIRAEAHLPSPWSYCKQKSKATQGLLKWESCSRGRCVIKNQSAGPGDSSAPSGAFGGSQSVSA